MILQPFKTKKLKVNYILFFMKVLSDQPVLKLCNLKKLKKSIFGLNFEVLLINRHLWNLHKVIAKCLNLKLRIYNKNLCANCKGMKIEPTFM